MQDYHDQTVYRPVVIATQSPGPLANGLLGALPAQTIRNMALSGAIAFCVAGLMGGFWIAAKYFESRITAAENRASQAQQRQQQAENRLSAQLDQTAEFCESVLSAPPPPSTPSAAQPSGAVASNPHL